MKTNFPVEDFEKRETPFYYYDTQILRETLDSINSILVDNPQFRVHYALKANAQPGVLKMIANAGLGADCVSGGEIKASIEAGIPAHKIVYSGVGKTDWEIRLGIETGIGSFNVESLPELDVIDSIAGAIGKKAQVAIRINPDIDAHTHRYITTGTAEDQFGIPMLYIDKVLEHIRTLNNVDLKGLHFHIGSQLTDMTPYRMLVDTVNKLVERLEKNGVRLKTINVGGGLGIDYDNPDLHPVPDFKTYFDTFKALKLKPEQELHFELGRAIVAQCGSLITRVLYVKRAVNKNFAIVDAGFTELLRPALYGAHHKIDDLTPSGTTGESYDIVGPICESTDCFARNEVLPELRRGDLLAIRSAGAYGQSMSSQYNMRKLVKEIYS